jgi:S1-C subfamily serine protease
MSGALINKITENGLAASAGLKKNFLIEYCNDVRVLNSNQLFNLFESINGDIVLLGRYLEDDREREFVLVR